MENPSKLEEGGVMYSLGTFDGKQVFYDFTKILVYLEAKGKRLFGRDFTLQEKDREMLLKLSNYFIRDLENCEKDGIDPDKGILLTGPVSCNCDVHIHGFLYFSFRLSSSTSVRFSR